MLAPINWAARAVNRQFAGTLVSRSLLRTLAVPSNLAEVTDIKGEVGDAETARAVNRIWSAAEDLYCTGFYPALMLCIRKDGQTVMNRAIGYARGFDGDEGNKLARAGVNTPACLFSASKAVTAVVMHTLAEDGLIHVKDPVARYIPEFAANGKSKITIAQMLSHRGGVPDVPAARSPEGLLDHKSLLKALCAAAPIDGEGETQAYHAVTGGVILQEVLARVTGGTIRDYWRARFKEPMGFRFLDYGASREDYALMARDHFCGARVPSFMRSYMKGPLGVDLETEFTRCNEYAFFAEPIAAANMVGTAEEVSRFFQMLLDHGKYNGQQIIKGATVDAAVHAVRPASFDSTLKLPIRFSAGMMMGGDPAGYFGWRTGRAFGHLGMMNTIAWADPDRRISVGLVTTGKPVIAHNLPFFAQLVMRISLEMPRG